MWSNEPRSLPDWIEDAYQILVSGTPDQQTELSHDQAQDLLLTHKDFRPCLDAVQIVFCDRYLINEIWRRDPDGLVLVS
jgi:hypothetical protein